MTDWTATLWVAGGGAVGAYCRYGLSNISTAWFGNTFPHGTLIVNVLGSVILGVSVGGIQAGYIPAMPWHDLLNGGFLGALTTFSTFSMDTFAAFRDGNPVKAGLNIVVNVVCCLAGVGAGLNLFAAQ